MTEKKKHRTLPAIKVRQWMRGWDEVEYSEEENRRKPEPQFYIFSIPAAELRSLCGISRRMADNVQARADDLGIQRQHDEGRSDEIGRFVEYGFPWSTISKAKRKSQDFDDLRKPGWLPTAIVINIIPENHKRRDVQINKKDVVTIEENGGTCLLHLPYEKWEANWKTGSLPPFEIIDGQHRLFAFDANSNSEFEVPVVAFFGLDISWQAYLFYTINIKPKKINPSLAFDLYPLLRSEDWLDRAEGHSVYRETRSQELTESLWVNEKSPWHDRINMLGETGVTGVSQSAWIKSLMTTFIKTWSRRGKNTGGLFGSRLNDSGEVLGWSRAQQAAYLIYSWNEFLSSVTRSNNAWIADLRNKSSIKGHEIDGEPAFYSPYSLISTDQGVRGFLQIINDFSYLCAPRWELAKWTVSESDASADQKAIFNALKTLPSIEAASKISGLCQTLSSFDWRTSGAPNLDENQRRAKLVFRGSGGYKELRLQLLEHIIKEDNEFSEIANKLKQELFSE